MNLGTQTEASIIRRNQYAPVASNLHDGRPLFQLGWFGYRIPGL